MEARFANQEEIEIWDSLIVKNPDGGNFLQGSVFAGIKSSNGWKNHKIICSFCALTVLEKNIPYLGKIWYVPKGPGISNLNDLQMAIKELRDFAAKNRVFLIKIEPEINKNYINTKSMHAIGVYSGSIQPNTSTVYINIENDTDKMLLQLSQKTRHAINRARRDGLKVKELEINDANCKTMLSLLKETMFDKKALLRSDEYYVNFWKEYSKKNQGKLFVAYDSKRPVAGAFVIVFGNKATYKDGGSIKEKTIYGTSHALQWSIVEWLSKNQYKSYDLCGTPPSENIEDKFHPYYGVGQFKTSFNKNIVDYIGVYDVVVNRNKYNIWVKFVSKFIKYYYKYLLKSNYY